MFRILLLVLALQASPQIHWKSEVKQTPEGTNQLVLTGDLDEGIDHVTGTVTYMPCLGEACYLPVDWDFEEFFKVSGSSAALGWSPAGGSVDLSDGSAASGNRATLGTALPESEGSNTLWALILEAILWGFAMMLTPCVFPMVHA